MILLLLKNLPKYIKNTKKYFSLNFFYIKIIPPKHTLNLTQFITGIYCSPFYYGVNNK